MTHFFTKFSLAVIATLVFIAAPASADDPKDILVIANFKVPQDTIKIDDLKSIFLKMRTTWGGGMKVVAVNAPKGSTLREAFTKRVLKMNALEEKRYWQDYKIRHGKSGPPEFSSLLKAVFKVRGSVSYIYRSDYRKGVVKILLVVPAEAPAEGPAQ